MSLGVNHELQHSQLIARQLPQSKAKTAGSLFLGLKHKGLLRRMRLLFY
jgi:hypothetical protein